jgi:hypothetical protein
VDSTAVTVMIASHDPKVEDASDMVVELGDGMLVAASGATAGAFGDITR